MSSAKRSYSGDTARASVRAFKAARTEKASHPGLAPAPLSIAQATSGGASRQTIYNWLHSNMSQEAIDERLSHRGRHALLSEAQEALLVGHVIDRRLNLLPVERHTVIDFAAAYLDKTLRPQFVSTVLQKHGISLQQSLPRASRLVDLEVVDDALKIIVELRNEGWAPRNILVMDETGIWSNTVPKKTYHFRNWCEINVHHVSELFHLGVFPVPRPQAESVLSGLMQW
jgi:transposase